MTFQINKQLVVANKLRNSFSNVYGISETSIKTIKNFLGFNTNTSLNTLSSSQIQQIKFLFEHKDSPFFLSDRLRGMQNSVKRLININCYRGVRHRLHLPVNGQRTHSNSKTCKKRFIIKEHRVFTSNNVSKNNKNLKNKKVVKSTKTSKKK